MCRYYLNQNWNCLLLLKPLLVILPVLLQQLRLIQVLQLIEPPFQYIDYS
jgi:hypothetical protein